MRVYFQTCFSRGLQGILILVLLMEITDTLAAPCKGRVMNPVTEVCWDCLFPITLGSSQIVSGHNPDTANPSSPICMCPGNPLPQIGTALGYWEPMGLVDVTRSPGCLVNLGGIDINPGGNAATGDIATDSADQNSSFFQVHWYNYPLMQLLDEFSGSCREGGSFSLEYLSELDPTWSDDTAALTLFPETTEFATLSAQLACAADALSASKGLANDALFWCAGAQGTLYPVTGRVGEHIGGVQASVLLTERLDFKLHRLGILKDSSASHLCGQSAQATLPKSRYRYQMVYPTATTSSNGCQPFGRSTAVWGAHLETPTSSENYGYLIWRKRNCCSF